MGTAPCPRCGTLNPASAMNCGHCRINLEFARANPEVAQGLTQQIKSAKVVAEFLSSKWRYWTRMSLAFVVGLLIGVTLTYLTLGTVHPSSFVGPVSALVPIGYLVFRHYKIVITEESISGPSSSGMSTVIIPFREIDKVKTVGFWGVKWLDKRWCVYSSKGDRLIVSTLAFNQNQVFTILAQIGYRVEI